MSNKVYKSCKINIVDRESVVELLLLDFCSFDVIFGMDWLAAYHVNLDCFSKTITLNPPNAIPYFWQIIFKINENTFVSVFTQSLYFVT